MSDAAGAAGARGGRLALPLVVVAGLAACLTLVGCSKKPIDETSTQDTPLADIALVAAEDATSFTDLPGVDEFAALTPSLQAAVLARANRARCDCGCPGHSVNACLHQEEACDVALGLARGFVADAEALALNAPEAAGASAVPAEEAAASAHAEDETGGESGSAATPADAAESGAGDMAAENAPESGAAATPADAAAVPAASGATAPMPVSPAPAEAQPAPAGATGPAPTGASAPVAPAASGR